MGIVDDMALYALGYWVHESHPVRMDSFCLNTVQRKTPCSNCTDACPHNVAVHEKQVDWSACTNCNLCVTACPTQAVHESGASMDTVLSCLGAPGDYVSFACGRCAQEEIARADVRVACLAALPWELVAALALRKRVVLRVSPCKGCPDADRFERVGELFAQLKRFFGPQEFKARIFPRIPSSVDLASDVLVNAAARRRAFAGFASTVKRGAVNLVGEEGLAALRVEGIGEGRAENGDASDSLAENEGAEVSDGAENPASNLAAGGADGEGGVGGKGNASGPALPEASHYRALLLKELMGAPEQERPDVTWLTLVEDGNCRGCGICVNMCPHHAIALRIAELDEYEKRKAEQRGGARVTAHARAKQDDATRRAPECAEDCAGAVGAVSPLFPEALYAQRESGAPTPFQALIHEASRCTQCGLCYMSCPNDNLGGWDELRTAVLPAVREHGIDVKVCEKCGRPFKQKADEVRCPACSRFRFAR